MMPLRHIVKIVRNENEPNEKIWENVKAFIQPKTSFFL